MAGVTFRNTVICMFIVISFFSGNFILNIFISTGASIQDSDTGTGMDPVSDSYSRAGKWQLADRIEKTIEVDSGTNHFVYFDYATGTLNERTLPPADAGLNKITMEALSKVPNWLRDDVALKFRETASVPIRTLNDNAAAAFVDFDLDYDLDLILGQGTGGLRYFENIGTRYQPVFVHREWFLSELNNLTMPPGEQFLDTSPAAADVDGDFDIDILVGTQSGSVLFFENFGTVTKPSFTEVRAVPVMTEASSTSPSFVDYDTDKDFDVVVGDGSGKISLYTNVGSNLEPNWIRARPNPFSEIQVVGEAAPYLADLDDDGDLDITIGDSTNSLSYYRCVTDGIAKSYVLDETMYLGLTLGTNNHPALVDIDNDRLFELRVGNSGGTINSFDNLGNAFDPQWVIISSYKAIPGISYYPILEFMEYLEFSITDDFANVIAQAYNSNPLFVDEVAFAIAHTSKEVLRGMNSEQIQIFYENARLIYEIDPFLDYAEVKEYNTGTGDYYSTVSYRTIDKGRVFTREYPREIYYWYIVHPKITEEEPGFVNPDNGDRISRSDGGRFWREYLFYHADTAYPADTSGSPNDGIDDYPKSFGPPLLKDLLSGVKYLWNGTSFVAPGGRDPKYGDHALIRVSNWVGKTLILNQQEVSDEERPNQPVRIAHHHNGNCGELQDLTTAGARTALIPAAGVNLMAEDHVWIEFFENGWNHWDNHWSDAGSHIDRYHMYWKDWGKRGGSGIWMHKGNDDTVDVTHKYIPVDSISRVIVKVTDRNGFPVDGARVLFGSHWLVKGDVQDVTVTAPFPSIWNYTDVNGETEFRLAAQDFTIKVISRLGNAGQNKTHIGEGKDYFFNFTLDGALPNPVLRPEPVTVEPPDESLYKFEASYTVLEGVQYPPNPESGGYHPEPQVRSNLINSFMTDLGGFINFQIGRRFTSMELQTGQSAYTFSPVELDGQENWYMVLSNLNTVETSKRIKLDIKLYIPLKDEPFISIDSPLNNSMVLKDSITRIEGSVFDEDGIKSIMFRLKEFYSGTVMIERQLTYDNSESWFYDWDTRRYEVGFYRIEAEAVDEKGLKSTAGIIIELIKAGAPKITILNPSANDQFHIGDTIEVNGTCTDNGYIESITITLGEDKTFDITSSFQDGKWAYFWDTVYEDEGFMEIKMTAVDNDDNTATASIVIELLPELLPPDIQPPEVSILTPSTGSVIEKGEVIVLSGFAFDDREIQKLYLTFSDLEFIAQPSIDDEGKWFYEWSSSSVPEGDLIITINAEDGSGNTAAHSITVLIQAPKPPSDHQPPTIVILSPTEDEQINSGSELKISGTATDDFGLTGLEFSYDVGETWIDLTGTLTGSTWEYIIDTRRPLMIPDQYLISVRGEDTSGNIGSTETTIYIVDDTPPDLDILLPENNQKFKQGQAVELSCFADDNFGIDKIKVKLNIDKKWQDFTRYYDRDSGMFQIQLDGSEFSVGPNVIKVKAVDIYDNENEQALTILVEAEGSDSSKNAVENSMDFLLLTNKGRFICGTGFLIIVIIAFAIMSRRPKPVETEKKKKKIRKKK